MKKTIVKLTARVARAVATRNVNSTCSALYHQPKVPMAAKMLKK